MPQTSLPRAVYGDTGAGEVVVWSRCPRDFHFYVMDDDNDAGVRMIMMMTII